MGEIPLPKELAIVATLGVVVTVALGTTHGHPGDTDDTSAQCDQQPEEES